MGDSKVGVTPENAIQFISRFARVRRLALYVACLTCHGPGKYPGPEYQTLSDHTHHDPLSAGSRCIECHMPKTGENAVAGESRNHTFNFISPAESIKNGVPNSCNGCHADKTPEWVLADVKKWYPKQK